MRDPRTGALIASNPKPPPKAETPADMQVALWVNGGDEAKARAWLKQTKTPKGEAPKTPVTKFAFDRKMGQNRSVSAEEEAAEPARFAPPISPQQVKLFNPAGQEVGTGDPNDPAVQARITNGEVRTAPPRQFSGEQSKAAGFANDAITSEKNVEALMNPVAKPGQPVPERFDPTGHQGWSMSNLTTSANLQKYNQAKKNWGLAVLRQESGGAITEKEAEEYADAFFPKYGDKPEVVAQKKAQREEKIRGVIAASGGAYQANFGAKDSAPSQTPPPASADQATNIPPPEQRKAGAVYDTPRGRMTWTGTGWVPYSEPVA